MVLGDYDDDGVLDVFVANDTTPNFLFHNDGKGRFVRGGAAIRRGDGQRRAGPRGHGHRFRRLDGDGDLDLFVTNHELETHTLYRNLGKGLFRKSPPKPASAHRRFPLSGLAPRSSITTTMAISTSAS